MKKVPVKSKIRCILHKGAGPNTWWDINLILYLTFFGHVEGYKVDSKMHDKMSNGWIPVDNVVTLVADGPNVNKTIL